MGAVGPSPQELSLGTWSCLERSSGPSRLHLPACCGDLTSLRAFCVAHASLSCELPLPGQLGLATLAW